MLKGRISMTVFLYFKVGPKLLGTQSKKKKKKKRERERKEGLGRVETEGVVWGGREEARGWKEGE